MNQQAAKGTPGQGKLSKQLQTQKQANPHSLADRDDQPERVVVSAFRRAIVQVRLRTPLLSDLRSDADMHPFLILLIANIRQWD